MQLFRKKGEITVFLCLILSVSLGLLCVIFESARAQSVKFQIEIAMDAALRSCFGEYCKELYEDYDLLYIDTSYRVGKADIDNLNNHISAYMDENLDFETEKGSADLFKIDIVDVNSKEYLISSDLGGIPVYKQAVNYMKEYGDTSHLGKISAISSTGALKDVDSLYGGWDASLSRVESFGVEFVNPSAVVRGMCVSAPEQLMAARNKKISSLPYGNVPSNRSLRQGNYKNISDINEKEIFTEYILQKCGSYVHARSNTELLAEQEYILCGKENDAQNVKQVIERLIRIFSAKAYETLGGREEEMKEYAEMIVPPPREPEDPMGWFDREALVEAVADSLRYAWAQGEGILKTDRLLGGGRVNAPDFSAGWILPLREIMEYRGKIGSNGGSGYTYEEYVAGFLLELDRKTITMRFLDVVEINMRKQGCTGFEADGCIEYLKTKVETMSHFGYEYNITRDYSYENIYRKKAI